MIRMRLVATVSGLIMAAACTREVCAQALPVASGPGSYVSAGFGVSAYQADYGQRWLGGEVGFMDVHPTWRYGLEGEARLLNAHTNENVKEATYMVGPHVNLLSSNLRPYVKFLMGAGKIDLPFHYAQGTFLAYAPGAGVDYIVSDRLSLRLIDIEYQSWPQFTYGNLHPYGVSAGVMFRINRVKRYATR